MKKSIHQVAADVLAEHKRPMTADEIYEVILAKDLYEFNAKSPKSVLRSQLRRHSARGSAGTTNTKPIFKVSPEGLFSLV
jgi:hypothetical protein